MVIYSTFASVSGEQLEKAFWPAQGEPKAVVQLVHGMAEHIRRYDETAQKLAEAGFAVVGHTHMGHGKTRAFRAILARKTAGIPSWPIPTPCAWPRRRNILICRTSCWVTAWAALWCAPTA